MIFCITQSVKVNCSPLVELVSLSVIVMSGFLIVNIKLWTLSIKHCKSYIVHLQSIELISWVKSISSSRSYFCTFCLVLVCLFCSLSSNFVHVMSESWVFSMILSSIVDNVVLKYLVFKFLLFFLSSLSWISWLSWVSSLYCVSWMSWVFWVSWLSLLSWVFWVFWVSWVSWVSRVSWLSWLSSIWSWSNPCRYSRQS